MDKTPWEILHQDESIKMKQKNKELEKKIEDVEKKKQSNITNSILATKKTKENQEKIDTRKTVYLIIIYGLLFTVGSSITQLMTGIFDYYYKGRDVLIGKGLYVMFIILITISVVYFYSLIE